jgi:hypothetical protein
MLGAFEATNQHGMRVAFLSLILVLCRTWRSLCVRAFVTKTSCIASVAYSVTIRHTVRYTMKMNHYNKLLST